MTKDEIRAKVRETLDRAKKWLAERKAANLCIEPTCTKPPLGDTSRYVLGDDHCEEHARQFEIEMLVEDQEDDAEGKLPL